MSGIFTGTGVGPGDPELITLKALRVIEKSSVLALPVSDRAMREPAYYCRAKSPDSAGQASEERETSRYLDGCTAYQTARRACKAAEEKDVLFLPMPMIKDKEQLKAIHDRDVRAVARLLDEGRDVAFLTIGDPSVYSTCMYVHKRLKRMGYNTALIPGVTSFCAVAARLDCSLAENREELHILPASYEIEESLRLPGTKVLMKAGKKLGEVKRLLTEKGLDAKMVENCGMEEERVYYSQEEIPEQAGYYSLLVVKEKSKKAQREKRRERL